MPVKKINVFLNIYTVPVKSFLHFNQVSYAHQGCICAQKYSIKYNIMK